MPLLIGLLASGAGIARAAETATARDVFDREIESESPKALEGQQQQHGGPWWSLQPVVQPTVPQVTLEAWANQPVDRFVLAQLEAHGLRPARRADHVTLIRRLSFALAGLPPASDEVDRFAQDTSPDAYEQFVDHLLASPHYGERWARHWMDVVRYTDTYGYEWDIPAKGAWRYRDYLVRAFNQDVPFDQLLREQIAGDLLDPPRVNSVDQINESLLGLMFFQMGEKRHGDSAEFNGIHQEMLDNKVDAFSKAFQATTISCARCHDHKLEPILQREYYALAGVFMSSRWVTNTVDRPDRNASSIAELKGLKVRLRRALAKVWKQELKKLSITLPPESQEPPLEDLLHPWWRLAKTAGESGSIAHEWQSLAKRYAEQQRARSGQNCRDFVLVADFSQGVPDGWSVDGVGLRDAVACGDFTVALVGPAAVVRILTSGLFTHAISPRLNGALRTPYLNQFEKSYLSFESCGGDFAAHRTVVDNAFLTERQVYLKQDNLGWIRISTLPTMRDRKIYVELATKASNPNFPPRVGLGGDCSEEEAGDPKSWFGVTRVLMHDTPAAPADELARFEPLFAREPPQDLGDAARRFAQWLGAAVTNWGEDRATPDDVRLINALLDKNLITNRHDLAEQPEVAEIVRRYRELEQALAEPWTVNGMVDVEPGYDYRLNVRGDYDQLGDAVPRGYLHLITGSHGGFAVAGSGRRELAELVASPSNPLTARVLVNRVWHWLFGTGIVSTPDDFGFLGERPSHPELLDYLASRFMAEGWSLKKLVRTIVLSQTWQQSDEPVAAATVADPDNRWLHHYPLRRLEAEAIRDAVLSVSGRLDRRLFGPPINPHRQNEDPQKRLFSGPVAGAGRRSLYLKMTIMEPPRLLATFNQPVPKIPTGHRDVTNTPAQSLALLNDPFASAQAEHWAFGLVALRHQNVADRLSSMFQTALGRGPTNAESERWSEAAADLAVLHGVAQVDLMHSVPVWRDVAHAMFNCKEFIYIQ